MHIVYVFDFMPTGIGICLFLISSAIELIYRPALVMFSTAASALPTLLVVSADQFSDASTFPASSDEVFTALCAFAQIVFVSKKNSTNRICLLNFAHFARNVTGNTNKFTNSRTNHLKTCSKLTVYFQIKNIQVAIPQFECQSRSIRFSCQLPPSVAKVYWGPLFSLSCGLHLQFNPHHQCLLPLLAFCLVIHLRLGDLIHVLLAGRSLSDSFDGCRQLSEDLCMLYSILHILLQVI